MRGGVTATVVLVLLLAAVPLAGAGSRQPHALVPSMAVIASPRAAGAHAIRLTATLRYEMQCDYPGAGPLVVTFPSALKLPQQFVGGTVRLGGEAIAATVKGRRVTVMIPPHKGVLCDVMARGSVTLVFTRAAELTNPAQAGFYRFTATHGARTFTAKLAIKPAA
jgi:hypothetical protein